MARRRARTSATGGNMDSMLDTLTNVVGILIIVLVTVQLSSQEAAARIAAAIQKLDPGEVARIEAAAETAKTDADRLQQQIDRAVKPKSDPAAEAARLDAEAAAAETAARDMTAKATAVQKQKADQASAARRAADAAAKAAAEAVAKAEAALKKAEDAKLALAAELEKTTPLPPPPVKEVRLPDPRPAPANAKELRVLCREGKLWAVDVEELQERGQKRAAYVIGQKKLDPDGDNWLSDGKAFADAFNAAPVRTDDFEMTLAVPGMWPQLVLTRKPGSGQPVEKAVASGGDFARMLRRYKPTDHIVRFFVWPDGFEAYLAARQAAGASGYAAGWELVTSPAEHQISLNKYGIGTKPPPPPPDQKKPPAPDVLD